MSAPTDSEILEVSGPELTAAQVHDILRLRVDVFVVEQECPYPEIDGADLSPTTQHVWIEDVGGVAAYIRLLGVDDGTHEPVRIGRVVTRPDRRGEQLARRLIERSLRQLGPIETALEAQTHLVDYYAALGFEPAGAEYLEDGIPHTPMRRPAPNGDAPTRVEGRPS